MPRDRVLRPPVSAHALKQVTQTDRPWGGMEAEMRTGPSSPRGWQSGEALRPSRCPSHQGQTRQTRRGSSRKRR
jgi:hypothetical protein